MGRRRPMAEPSTRWTPQQKAGIETTGVNLLVSAAAGSGKTAVLAERCVHLLCDAEQPCSVDELLVVTFTELAAAQMKERIRAALQRRHDGDPDDPRVLDQLAQIDRAQVSTLHGFCARLLRRHFHLVGLDPSFTTLDGEEAKVLARQTVHDLIAERYETDEDGTFQKLIDFYADGDDTVIQKSILDAHHLLASLIHPDAWLQTAGDRLQSAAADFTKSEIGAEIRTLVREKLQAFISQCDTATQMLQRLGMPKPATYLADIRDTVSDWCAFADKGDLTRLASLFADFVPGRKPSISNSDANKPLASSALEIVDDLKESDLAQFLRFTTAEWEQGLRSLLPFAQTFISLVKEFSDRYQSAKSRIRSVDFADLERFALRILRSNDGPSDTALNLQRSIAHVLVDEYQDINAVQDEILRLVSRERSKSPNLFCVGDVKQSIYRFRLAEPERFIARSDRYRGGDGGRVIDLQQNFRSRPPLLEAINVVFERLMTRRAVDIEYDASQRLIPGAIFPPTPSGLQGFSGAPIELHILPRIASAAETDEDQASADLDRTDREALFVAKRIVDLVASGVSVADKDAEGNATLRPVEYRDIAILLRAAVHKAEQFAETLSRHGIPVYRESGSGFFDTTEVRDLLSLLHLLDNPRQDFPLAAVIRSPISNFRKPEDALALIRLAYPADTGVPFHEAVLRYAAEQTDDLAAEIKGFLDSLDRWRQASRNQPLSQVIWSILEDTGYLTFCSALDNGEQRAVNLLHLYDRAKQAGAASGRGLYRFLRAIERLREEADLGVPTVIGENENVVRILSIHKSKGLEFPIVFLPDLGKRFNLGDLNSKILLDRTAFLGLPAIDEPKQARYPSAASVLLKHQIRQKSMAEEVRVLYVAMTRAKEHLILAGTADEKSLARWQSFSSDRGPVSRESVIGAATPLDWIAPIAISNDAAFKLESHTSAEISEWESTGSRRKAMTPWQTARAELKPLAPAPTPNALADEVMARLSYTYPQIQFVTARAALPATEWAKRDTPQVFNGPKELPLPCFTVSQATAAGCDRGTATHLVLQHLKFTEESIARQIQRMVHQRLLTSEQAAMVDIRAIDWFLSTDLAREIQLADETDRLREIPFTYAVPSKSADPMDRPMIRGRIDLLLCQDRRCRVIDYKTDSVTGDALQARADAYSRQLIFYRQAIEELTGLKVSGSQLVFLFPRAIIDC